MRETEILHHLLTCLSTLSLAVRGYKLCISKCKLIEVVQDFFHPPKKKRNSCIFGLANFFRPSATSRGSIPSSVLLIVPPVCFSRTQHCKPPATPTLHYTQHYTLHYTQHYTQHCRNAARGSISAQDRKIVLYFHFIP